MRPSSDVQLRCDLTAMKMQLKKKTHENKNEVLGIQMSKINR